MQLHIRKDTRAGHKRYQASVKTITPASRRNRKKKNRKKSKRMRNRQKRLNTKQQQDSRIRRGEEELPHWQNKEETTKMKKSSCHIGKASRG